MGKLGKKARKFAKKQLQSVLRQRRKTKALFKRKTPKGRKNVVDKKVANSTAVHSNERITKFEDTANIALDGLFTKNLTEFEDLLDSDGYLSEDLPCPSAMEKTFEDENVTSSYSDQNKKVEADLALQVKKLDKLRKKDPGFSRFLENHNSTENEQNEDEYSDVEDTRDQDDDSHAEGNKLLTSSVINTWCQMVRKDNSQPALVSLLNAYRAACHYGAESSGRRIESSETFCNIILFTLSNVDDILRGQLEISSLNSTREMLSELKKNVKWKALKPLVKSYARSTLFLLNHVTDYDLLAFVVTRLRASIIFFAAFPSLMQRLIKTTVHLWATSGNRLSSTSYILTQNIASIYGPDYFDACLSNTLASFISRSRVTGTPDVQHMQFLRDCTLKMCSIDVQNSSLKAAASITQLSQILSLGLQTKKKEVVKKICSWEYVNCVDLWVMFVSTHLHDYNLHSVFFMLVKLISSLAYMFPGPRYFPLRLKCIQWLNLLSRSSGKFIPIASLVLDVLEYKFAKGGRKIQDTVNVTSVLKLPKHYLKSRSFEDECFHSAIEQLSLHFLQWSYHISFPDLATIPLLQLGKIHGTIAVESMRRMVKRFMDQVEQNVEFVRIKRDEVSFSPHDHQSADSFLQFEKFNVNTPFTQYYQSVVDKAAERNLSVGRKASSQEKQSRKRMKTEAKNKAVASDDHLVATNSKPQKRIKGESS